MFCNNCGAQLPDGSKFCQNCGAGQAPAAAPNNDFISATPKTELAFDAPVADFTTPVEPPVVPQPEFVPPVEPPVAPQPEFVPSVQPPVAPQPEFVPPVQPPVAPQPSYVPPMQPPVAPQPSYVPPMQPPMAPITPPPAPKKNNTGIIIAVVVALLVVAGIIVGVVLGGNGSSNDDDKEEKKDETTSSQVSSTTTTDDDDYYGDYSKNYDQKPTTPVAPPSSGISRGTISGNVYRNDFANITFTKHSSWKYLSDKEMLESYYAGSDVLAGDSFDANALLEQTGSFYDMMVSSPAGYPNLNIVIQDLNFSALNNITVEEYLNLIPGELKKINPGYECSEPRSTNLCGETYGFIDASVEINSVKVLQRMYIRFEGQYMIQITMTATAENSFETMENMFS